VNASGLFGAVDNFLENMMLKIDYKKEMRELYQPSAKKVSVVSVPPMKFLKIDGKGDPNTSSEFANATEALFSVSYALKFMVRQGPLELDYGVMPLEGLWWTQNMALFSIEDKSAWLWTLMIMQPDCITAQMAALAIEKTSKKKENLAINKLRFESYKEGKAAQIMHIGPFTTEGPTVAKVHAFITAAGSQPTGHHHEIYLSDIRRAAPEKWKTIIRQPMS
jgi:hypothetical protein